MAPVGVTEERPYTDEELFTAHQAAKDFMDSLGEESRLVTARDLAMFDAGFKRGRRTPPPATLRVMEQISCWLQDEFRGPLLILDDEDGEKMLAEWNWPKEGGSK